MKKLLLAALIPFLALASCKKDNNNRENCPVTTTSLSGTYKLTAWTYKPSADAADMDWYASSLEACKKDDLYTINADGTFSVTDAGTVCSPSGSYPNGTWTLQFNRLNLDGYYSGNVESFDCKTLVISDTSALNTGDKITSTFVKQ